MYLIKKYGCYTDEYLLTKLNNEVNGLRSGNNEITDYLLHKYKGLVKKKARAMFLIGGDTDDLIQEGMIGLYKAIRDFKPDKETSFYTFADKCIARQIYTAINTSNRKKHIPLNTYISFYSIGADGDYENFSAFSNICAENDMNPEELFIDRENVKRIKDEIFKSLSGFEKQVLELYTEGVGYVEISNLLNREPKSIDNAIQRIKGKVSGIIRMIKNQ